MSGLDGLGWPTPDDVERERDQFRAQLREEQQLHIQTLNERDEAQERADTMFAKHVDILEQTRNERDEARGQLAGIEERLRGELGGHPDSELWGDAGLIAATMRCVDALDTVTEQRDELIRAGRALKAAKGRFHTEQAATNLFNLLP